MEQKELPGFNLDEMETSPGKKRHVFMSIMSDVGHLEILSTERKTSTAWDRLAKHRVQSPALFNRVIETLESF